MARYLVTSGSKFTPLSYDEIIAPLAQATEAHKQTQEIYDELAANAGSVGALLGERNEGNAKAYQLYDDYNNLIDSYIDDLSNNGYGIRAQRGLSELRQRYGRDITGIQNAIARKREQSKYYADAQMKDPSLILEYNPWDEGLDKYLDNPEYGTPKSLSGAYLEQVAGKAAEALKTAMSSEANVRKWMPILGGQYYEAATFTGAKPEDIQEAKAIYRARLAGETVDSTNPIANALADIIQSTYATSGVSQFNDPDGSIRATALDYIERGLNQAVGKTEFQTLNNKAWDYAQQRALAAMNQKQEEIPEDQQYYHWQYGKAEYDGMKQRAAVGLQEDLSMLYQMQQDGNGGKGFQYTEQQMKENAAKKHAMNAIRDYFIYQDDIAYMHERDRKGKRTVNDDKYRSIEKAYNDAIYHNPELADIKYYTLGSNDKQYNWNPIAPVTRAFHLDPKLDTGMGRAARNNSFLVPSNSRNQQFYEMYNRLDTDPSNQFKRMQEQYAPGRPDITVDELIPIVEDAIRSRVKVSRPATLDATNNTSYARWLGDYLTGNKNDSYAKVRDANGDNVDIEMVSKLMNDTGAYIEIDPNSRMGNGNMHVSVFKPETGEKYYINDAIFGGRKAPVDVNTLGNRAEFLLRTGQVTFEDYVDFNNNVIVPLSAQRGDGSVAIKLLADWIESKDSLHPHPGIDLLTNEILTAFSTGAHKAATTLPAVQGSTTDMTEKP